MDRLEAERISLQGGLFELQRRETDGLHPWGCITGKKGSPLGSPPGEALSHHNHVNIAPEVEVPSGYGANDGRRHHWKAR